MDITVYHNNKIKIGLHFINYIPPNIKIFLITVLVNETFLAWNNKSSNLKGAYSLPMKCLPNALFSYSRA